jgi:hypothetical protein
MRTVVGLRSVGIGATYEHLLVNARLEYVVGSGGVLSACYGISANRRQCFLYPDRRSEGNQASDLAGRLSERLGVAILAADVYDSDLLRMDIFRAGKLSHRYNSWPELFGGEDHADDAETVGADPNAFEAFAAGPVDRALLARALDDRPGDAAHATEGRGYVCARQAHHDFLLALGLPAQLALDYRSLSRPWPLLPAGVEWSQVALFGDAAVPPLMTPDLLHEVRALLPDRTLSFADIAARLGISIEAIFLHVPDLKDVRQGRTPT